MYIPPSDVFPPEGRWAALTYEVQDGFFGGRVDMWQAWGVRNLRSPRRRSNTSFDMSFLFEIL